MKILRVFPISTSMTPDDDMVAVGSPGLFRPEADEVHVSVTFTWDIPEGLHLERAWRKYYPNVRIGGPAFGNRGGNFTAGMYVKQGVTITSRGCPNRCPWCLVKIPFRELDTIEPGHTVQDDNILAASKKHFRKVIAMLKQQPEPARFAGGLEARRLTQWHVDMMREIRIGELWFAADTWDGLFRLQKKADLLWWLPRRKLRCFVLIGRFETIPEAEKRLELVWDSGFLPFAQLYQPEDYIKYSQEWKDLARKWSRPAAMFANHKEVVS